MVSTTLKQLGEVTTKTYILKDKHCIQKAKAGGVVDLECDLVYNPIRAGIRTFTPKEVGALVKDDTFKRTVRLKTRTPGNAICSHSLLFPSSPFPVWAVPSVQTC